MFDAIILSIVESGRATGSGSCPQAIAGLGFLAAAILARTAAPDEVGRAAPDEFGRDGGAGGAADEVT